MAVEAVQQLSRDVAVTFSAQFLCYFAGETAAFTAGEAQSLANLGVINETVAPVNTAVPHVSQSGTVLTCTMGLWDNTPTGYAYQWQLNGINAGTNASTYTRQPADVGQTATCVVTATNSVGSTAAPPSVGVVVT